MQSIIFIRATTGTMWPGAQPKQGEFSTEYIRKIKHIVQSAAKRGIYTLLDMHQDVISENMCGEGKHFTLPTQSLWYYN